MHSVCNYFNLPDSTALQWAHAVNHQSLLTTVAENPSIHLAEGDVYYAADDALPIMAHAWQDIADLDVMTFLTTLAQVGKGAKLDFHNAAAVEPTLQLVQRLKLSTPVILHANVFSLLPDEGAEGLEPEQFLRLCQNYCPTSVVSLGWSLKREHDADGRVEDVLIQQVADMILKRLGPVNYGIEIRAGYTAGWERGAALFFDPLPSGPTPSAAKNDGTYGANVVSLSSRRAA